MSDEQTTSAPEAGNTNTAPAKAEPTSRMYTQDELDSIVAERVNKSKAQFKDYKELKDQVAQIPTLQQQISTLTTEKNELSSDFTAAARDAQYLKIALDKGVPADLVDRLKGDTPEEIAADADKLLSQVGKRTGNSGFNGGVAPGSTPFTPESADAILRRAAGYA